MAYHHEDAIRRSQLERRVNHMLDQGLASGAVQYLGLRRFHTRPQAGGQDDDRQLRFHGDFLVFLNLRCLPLAASENATAAAPSGFGLTVADSSSRLGMTLV